MENRKMANIKKKKIQTTAKHTILSPQLIHNKCNTQMESMCEDRIAVLESN